MIVDWFEFDNIVNTRLHKAFLYSLYLVNFALDSTFVTTDVNFMIS